MEQEYPPEAVGQLINFNLTNGLCFLRTGVIYFPEDVMPVIRSLSKEQLQELTQLQWKQSP